MTISRDHSDGVTSSLVKYTSTNKDKFCSQSFGQRNRAKKFAELEKVGQIKAFGGFVCLLSKKTP